MYYVYPLNSKGHNRHKESLAPTAQAAVGDQGTRMLKGQLLAAAADTAVEEQLAPETLHQSVEEASQQLNSLASVRAAGQQSKSGRIHRKRSFHLCLMTVRASPLIAAVHPAVDAREPEVDAERPAAASAAVLAEGTAGRQFCNSAISTRGLSENYGASFSLPQPGSIEVSYEEAPSPGLQMLLQWRVCQSACGISQPFHRSSGLF